MYKTLTININGVTKTFDPVEIITNKMNSINDIKKKSSYDTSDLVLLTFEDINFIITCLLFTQRKEFANIIKYMEIVNKILTVNKQVELEKQLNAFINKNVIVKSAKFEINPDLDKFWNTITNDIISAQPIITAMNKTDKYENYLIDNKPDLKLYNLFLDELTEKEKEFFKDNINNKNQINIMNFLTFKKVKVQMKLKLKFHYFIIIIEIYLRML